MFVRTNEIREFVRNVDDFRTDTRQSVIQQLWLSETIVDGFPTVIEEWRDIQRVVEPAPAAKPIMHIPV